MRGARCKKGRAFGSTGELSWARASALGRRGMESNGGAMEEINLHVMDRLGCLGMASGSSAPRIGAGDTSNLGEEAVLDQVHCSASITLYGPVSDPPPLPFTGTTPSTSSHPSRRPPLRPPFRPNAAPAQASPTSLPTRKRCSTSLPMRGKRLRDRRSVDGWRWGGRRG